MPERPRAALYARFSTDLQNDRSVDDQLSLCESFCASQGLDIAARYHDRARSGATLHGRDGLQRLLVDARSGRFDLVVVEALDRLSRDQEDLAGLHKRLTFSGIEIIAVHDGRADAIQVGIRGLVSTLFLADLKHKIRRGMGGVVADGRVAGGKAYGYRPVPGRPGEPEVDDAEAAVVRRIFAEYAAGRAPREIAGRLNADSVPPPRGRVWSANTINGSRERMNGILHNPLYRGEIVWNRIRMVRDPDTGKRVSRQNPEAEWHRSPAPHLRIVDEDLWSAAQARCSASARGRPPLARLADAKPLPRGTRLLSGLLRCERCGGGLVAHDRRGAVRRITCSTAKESGSCDNRRRYRLDLIERAVVDTVLERLREPDSISAWLESVQADERDTLKRRAKLERQATEAAAKVERLQKNLIDGRIDESFFDAQIGPARADLASRRAALAEIDAVAPAKVVSLHPASVAGMAEVLTALRDHLPDLDPREDREMFEAFRSLIERVVIHDRPDGRYACEIVGRIIPLLGGANRENLVAEEGCRFIPPAIWWARAA